MHSNSGPVDTLSEPFTIKRVRVVMNWQYWPNNEPLNSLC